MSLARGLVVTGFIAAFALGFLVRGSVDSSPVVHAQAANRVFELRTYTVAPGKLDALHARFRDHGVGLFAKHGIKNVTFWTPSEGPLAGKTLIYVLPHASRKAAETFWAGFRADPEWLAVKAASEVDGPLTTKVESVFMTATDYSAEK